MNKIVAFLVTTATAAFDTVKAEVGKIEHVVETIAVSEVHVVLAKAKDSDLGTRAMNLLEGFEEKGLTLAEKAAKLLPAIRDDVQAFHDAGGLEGLALSVEHFAETAAMSFAADFENALGLKAA